MIGFLKLKILLLKKMLGVFRLSGKPRGTGRAKPFRAEGQSPSCTEEEDKNVLL